ncbi:MAG: hypothetical protein QOJ87_1968, partial [Verrucomicrobiota bacterium]
MIGASLRQHFGVIVVEGAKHPGREKVGAIQHKNREQ